MGVNLESALGETERSGVVVFGVDRRAANEFERASVLRKLGESTSLALAEPHRPVGESFLTAEGRAGLLTTGVITGREVRRILPSVLLILALGSGKFQFASTGAPADACELAEPKRRLRDWGTVCEAERIGEDTTGVDVLVGSTPGRRCSDDAIIFIS